MIEVAGNLFEPSVALNVSAIVLTTNGDTRQDGAAVMGHGVAVQAVFRWPGIEFRLGHLLQTDGNIVHRLTIDGFVALGADMGRKYKAIPCSPDRKYWRQSSIEVPYDIYSLPVKYRWQERANTNLIKQSLLALRDLTQGVVVLPRPGCGAGGLLWEDVKPIVQEVLHDDRFVVTERA